MTTPWPAMLRLAVGTLRLTPEMFWRLSLKEWRALTGEGSEAVLDREGLDALTRAYPD